MPNKNKNNALTAAAASQVKNKTTARSSGSKQAVAPATSRPLSTPAPGGSPAPAATHGETIMVAVTGMSPAIVTETIWALAEQQQIVPHRVVILTTTTGQAQAEKQLFTPSPDFADAAVWDSLIYSLEQKGFSMDNRLRYEAHVMQRWDQKKKRNLPLDDIRDQGDNEAAADFILEKLRTFVETPGTRVIASIAGGRKTMGALLFSAMSLIGRETDAITHVLVQEPFEAPLRPPFYYPGQPCQQLELRDRDGKVLSTHKAA
ncbi:MAG: CRISPR-associated ring nuclease Csm6, partial [Verrucomicrobiales bacterium]